MAPGAGMYFMYANTLLLCVGYSVVVAVAAARHCTSDLPLVPRGVLRLAALAVSMFLVQIIRTKVLYCCNTLLDRAVLCAA